MVSVIILLWSAGLLDTTIDVKLGMAAASTYQALQLHSAFSYLDLIQGHNGAKQFKVKVVFIIIVKVLSSKNKNVSVIPLEYAPRSKIVLHA